MNATAPPYVPELSYNTARRAYLHISHSPEERARQELESYRREIDAHWETFHKACRCPEHLAILQAEWTRFAENIHRRWVAYLSAKSRTASPMITGPARFPADRNRKRMGVEQKRLDELMDSLRKGTRAILRKIDAATPKDIADSEERKRLIARVRRQIHSSSPLEKQNLAGIIRRAWERGDVEPARDALRYLREAQKSEPKPVFTDRHSIWRLLDEEPASKPERSGIETVAECAGAEVVRNHDEDRLQIIFPGKPDDSIRSLLKSRGFRWAPSHGAWQRKLTPNAEQAARSVLSAITQSHSA